MGVQTMVMTEIEEGVNQFGEEPKSKSSNKKVFIKVIHRFE
jgi:hypothetical protein